VAMLLSLIILSQGSQRNQADFTIHFEDLNAIFVSIHKNEIKNEKSYLN
tara:strand:+ start:81 stop:227 length:147 start_codon:yes stop_codon:yes gene_type:complete